jgi:hypothetical protein
MPSEVLFADDVSERAAKSDTTMSQPPAPSPPVAIVEPPDVTLTAAACFWDRDGSRPAAIPRVDLSLTLSVRVGAERIRPAVDEQMQAAWQALEREAQAAPELVAARSAHARLADLEGKLALARVAVMAARSDLEQFVRGDAPAKADMGALTGRLSAAEAHHQELEKLRPPLEAAWRTKRAAWLQRADRLANQRRIQLWTEADEGRRSFGLTLPAEAVAALVALLVSEQLRDDASQLSGDYLSRRLAPDLDAAIAASEPLPLPEAPPKTIPPWRCSFMPHDSGTHLPFGPRPQPISQSGIATDKYKFTPFEPDKTPPTPPGTLPKGTT